MRERMLWVGIGVLSLLLAAALGLATSRLTEAPVGLTAEPVSADEALAPAPREAATATPTPTPDRERRRRRRTPTPTPTPARTPVPTAVPTAAPTAAPVSPAPDDDDAVRRRQLGVRVEPTRAVTTTAAVAAAGAGRATTTRSRRAGCGWARCSG